MKKLVTPIPQNTTELATPAPVSWIILTFVLSYLLNLSLSRYAWTPDFLALSMVFWVVHQPRRVGMTVAFVCGILMDVHNGSVRSSTSFSRTAPSRCTEDCRGSTSSDRRCTSSLSCFSRR